jgi:hypothetical protein
MNREQWQAARHSKTAIRARLEFLAIERGLHPAELPKSLDIDEAMLAFVRRHEISLDWLFRGCIRGLRGMTYDALHPGTYGANCDP